MDMISGLRYEAERLRKLKEAEEEAAAKAATEAAGDDTSEDAPPAS